MRFLLLGPLGVEITSDVVETLDGKQGILLSELLTAECRTVQVEQLVDEMYYRAPSGNHMRALIAHIARLRRKLKEWEPGGPSAERISYSARGYALKVAAAETDMGQFLSEAARASEMVKGSPEKAIPILESALALWRGPVLDGSHISLATGHLATRLEEVRLKASVELAAARIETGGCADAIVDLETLLHEHPYHERIVDLLMVALQRQGRITDAAQIYREFRRRFINDLGVSPHSVLSERMANILNNGETARRPYTAPCDGTRPAPGRREMPGCLRRIEAFADPGSFIPVRGARAGIGSPDTASAGICTVYDRPVALVSLAAPVGQAEAEAVLRLHEYAGQAGIPVVTIRSPAEHSEVDDLDSYAAILRSYIGLRGKVPRMAVMLGRNRPSLGCNVLSNDVTIAAGKGNPAMFEGAFPVAAEDEPGAYSVTRKLLSYLPGRHQGPLRSHTVAERGTMPTTVLDARDVIGGLADPGSTLELCAETAANIITALVRIDGLPLGVVANQPKVLDGRLSPDAARKGASFVTMCSTFGIPLLALVDTPGVDGDPRADDGWRVDQLLYAFCAARVPRFTVVVGRAHGRAYLAMNSRGAGASAVYAWPGAGTGNRSTEFDDVIAPERTRHVLRTLLLSS